MSKGRRWTEEEEEYLRTHYSRGKAEACAKHLNRSLRAVRQKVFYLGLMEPRQATLFVSRPAQYSTRYGMTQLYWLEQIGLAYSRDRLIDFEVAEGLREWVLERRYDAVRAGLVAWGWKEK